MFKNLQVFVITSAWTIDLQAAEAALDAARFVECGASQEKSIGWIEPRGEKNGPLIESIGGQWILKMMVESKMLPGSVVKKKVDLRVEEIEAQTGRKPGKKERRDITDDVKLNLLPLAFTKSASTFVWIDRDAGRLYIDSSSTANTDMVLTLLVKSFDGLALSPVSTQQSPAASMAIWLSTQEAPAGFTADRDCVLKACDESKASVRYAKHSLDIEEVKGHITMGKLPTQLAMTWNDRVSFLLTDSGNIKRLEFLDLVFEERQSDGDASAFDADVAIATGELTKMIPDVFEALGGLLVPTAAAST